MPVGSSSAPKKGHLCARKPWSLGVLSDPINTAWAPTLCLALQNVENCSQKVESLLSEWRRQTLSPVDGLEP